MNDDFKKFEKEGRVVKVIKSGKYKAAGVEGTSLSKEQEEELQGEVDELHRRFIRDVTSVRSMAFLDDLQGQSFYGDDAANRGLTTGVIDCLDDLIDEMKQTRKIAHSRTLPQLYQNNIIVGSDVVRPHIG
jgi:ClpP class serine protease